MIGIDTNVLVRYLVQDDVKQSKEATRFIEAHCTLESPGFVNAIVLCELVWVLESVYEYVREDIIRVIETILRTRQFHIHEPEIIWQALQDYHRKKADFTDSVIANVNMQNGCKYTITFDKKAARMQYVKLLEL